MAETFNKKEREKKRLQKKKEKKFRKDSRKETAGGDWESMIAYVDENGNLQDTPVDPKAKKEVKAKNIEIGVPKREKEEEEDTVLEGVINFFDAAKGYGFIKSEDDENFFMHQSNVSGDPVKGKKVRFEKEKGAKGWVAIKVMVQ